MPRNKNGWWCSGCHTFTKVRDKLSMCDWCEHTFHKNRSTCGVSIPLVSPKTGLGRFLQKMGHMERLICIDCWRGDN